MGYVDFKGSSGPSQATVGDVANKTTGATGAGGFHLAPLVNIAFPGANLSASATADAPRGIPTWALLAAAGVAAFLIWRYLRKSR